MSERKVLNKYYPPDFDPSKIPRLRLPKDRQYTVRLMAPCNMKCKTCGEYIYKGKKFNARKETVQNEEYLGIKIFRFYIKCPRCLAEITFKTDPENADYIVEHGATRNFQALKLAEEAARKEAMDIEEEEKNNPMKLLENRTKQSKQEMDSIEALEELKDLNQRHAKVDFEKLLKRNQLQLVEELKRQEDEDEDFIRSVFLTPDGEKIKRAFDDSDSNGKISSPVVQSSRPTDILCEDPEPSKNPSKKPKLWEKNSVSSSHEKCMAGLKNSLKVKKGSASSSSKSDLDESKSSVSANATTSEVNATTSEVNATSSEVNAQISEKPSALSLLCSYDNSDSDN